MSNVEPSDEKLVQFQNITGLPLEESMQYLMETRWNVEHAVSLFFDPTASFDHLRLQKEILQFSSEFSWKFHILQI